MFFLEFNLFSETRFVEHSHRTYDHFTRMFPILFEKLKRDEENSTSDKDQNKSIQLQNLLVQLEIVVDLLFMKDLSHLLTYSSKEFQRFDVLSFYAMNIYFNLKQQLHSARSSFESHKVPEPIHLHKNEYSDGYSVWKVFGDNIKLIIKSQTYENVKLVCRSERGRVLVNYFVMIRKISVVTFFQNTRVTKFTLIH